MSTTKNHNTNKTIDNSKISMTRMLVEARMMRVNAPALMLLMVTEELGADPFIKDITNSFWDMCGGTREFYSYAGITQMLRKMESQGLLTGDLQGGQKVYNLTTFGKRTLKAIRLNSME